MEWLKTEGDKLEKGESIVVVESDKADMDVETFYEGFLGAVVVESGGTANVGEAIAYIAETEAEIDEAVATLDPAVVVIGGGAGAGTFDQVAPAAREALAERLFARARRDPPPVVRAELGDDAGVVGAALLALQEAG